MNAPGAFWARRRAAVQAEAEAERRAEEQAQEAERAADLTARDDADVLADLGLPDPAGMKQGDDFAAFMAKGVPEHLRRKALRSLWRSNPVLACVDGLNDYDDDYRLAALAGGPVKTAYQVGKGMLRHIEEMERKASAVLAAAEDEECKTQEGTQDETLANAPVASESVTLTQTEEQAAQGDPADPAPPIRRMRFRFEEASA
jgi:hypothetical protein